jgi:hemerythrin superfamily protein/carbon monoxide dehydrogenase subunit G
VTTKVEKSIQVDVPVRAAYNQWTQFEEFPQFMGGVSQVSQISDTMLHWVAQIAGVRREWDAAILQQVPDERVAWAATEGATNAGAVSFAAVGPTATLVTLELEYEPEGVVEKAGDALNLVQRQVESDLERFKSYIESRGTETGGWRGGVNEDLPVGTPGAADAALTQGDSGKAGVSGKAVAAGAAAVVAGVAAATALNRGSDSDTESTQTEEVNQLDVVDVLTIDHAEVTALIGDIWATQDGELRRDLTDTVIAELVRHSVAEEMYVYPAMRKHLPDGDAAVEHDMAEHKQLETTMKQLEGVDVNDPTFAELLRQLETILADHVADEEREQFPELRARVPRAELVEIAQKVEAAKKVAPTRPHPAAPNNQVFHKLVGPGVGLVDRLRDKLSGRSTA